MMTEIRTLTALTSAWRNPATLMLKLVGVILALVVVAAPLVAEGQQPTKLFRVGYLAGGTLVTTAPLLKALREGLRELGWVEGQSIAIERQDRAQGRGRHLYVPRSSFTLAPLVPAFDRPGDW